MELPHFLPARNIARIVITETESLSCRLTYSDLSESLKFLLTFDLNYVILIKRLEVYPDDNCKLCPLHLFRSRVVRSRGNPESKLMIIGEAPGADEDKAGLPFVGRSGKLLDQLLEQSEIKDYYISNICKCRPQDNRVPTDLERKTCGNFLYKEIEYIKPYIIVTLGKTAAEFLLDQEVFITKIRGEVKETKFGKIIPTFHPSFLLRNHGKFDQIVVQDLKKAKEYVK